MLIYLGSNSFINDRSQNALEFLLLVAVQTFQIFIKNMEDGYFTSINKYMYHFIHKFSEEEIQIKYSITENLTNVNQINNLIVREASKNFDIKGLDINSIADIPKGSGLGSSSAYTVGLLHGLSLLNNKKISKNELAEARSDLEINKLGDPIGKQDHYASSYGGLNIFSFEKDDSVKVKINLDEKSSKFYHHQ